MRHKRDLNGDKSGKIAKLGQEPLFLGGRSLKLAQSSFFVVPLKHIVAKSERVTISLW